MSPTSKVFRASLRLPPDAATDDDLRPRSGLPAWVLLESLPYMVNVSNETTAGNTTPEGLHIQVSFLVAEPPRLSYCCICCTNREENPFASVPSIVSSVEDLVLIEAEFTNRVRHWFVYAARGGNPSLHLLPDFRLYSKQQLMGETYGLMSMDEGRQFVLAALSYKGDGQHDLHIFRSRESDWTQKRLQVDYGLTKKGKFIDPTYVIALGDGQLGWVDLWEGILICDVLSMATGMPCTGTGSRFVRMPMPLPSNQQLYLQGDLPWLIRDVTFSDGQIKCVEVERLVRIIPKAAPVVYDPSATLQLFDSESPMVPDQEEEDDEYKVLGWRFVTWYRELTWNHWKRGTRLLSDDLGHVSFPQQLVTEGSYAVNQFSFAVLQKCCPTLRDDIVYLKVMLDKRDENAWIVAVDTKTKSMSTPIPFSAERSTYIPCAFTKYLDTKSDGAPRNWHCNGSNKKRQRLP